MNSNIQTKDNTAGKGMILTERDRVLIDLVAKREALTRQQITRAMSFGSVTRANAVLLRLVRHRYLDRRFQPTLSGTRRAVYVLGGLGRELLGNYPITGRRFKTCSDLFLEHRLAINDAWLAFAYLSHEGCRLMRWLPEATLQPLALGCIPDAYLEYELNGATFAAFLEADLGTETLKRWQAKVQAYKTLAFSGSFERKFNRTFFRVLVVTTSERRVATLRNAIVIHTDRIFWITTRRELNAFGPLSAIWRRPKDASLQSLTQS